VQRDASAIGDRQAPATTESEAPANLSIDGRDAKDVWMLGEGSVLWHWNGVAWSPRPAGLATLIDLWVDEAGSAWVLGGTSARASAASRCLGFSTPDP